MLFIIHCLNQQHMISVDCYDALILLQCSEKIYVQYITTWVCHIRLSAQLANSTSHSAADQAAVEPVPADAAHPIDSVHIT